MNVLFCAKVSSLHDSRIFLVIYQNWAVSCSSEQAATGYDLRFESSTSGMIQNVQGPLKLFCQICTNLLCALLHIIQLQRNPSRVPITTTRRLLHQLRLWRRSSIKTTFHQNSSLLFASLPIGRRVKPKGKISTWYLVVLSLDDDVTRGEWFDHLRYAHPVGRS